MCGTVASVLHIPFHTLMRMSTAQLIILCNEAERQRMLWAGALGLAMNGGKDFQRAYQQAQQVHADYTEGYWEREMKRLKKDMGLING